MEKILILCEVKVNYYKKTLKFETNLSKKIQ